MPPFDVYYNCNCFLGLSPTNGDSLYLELSQGVAVGEGNGEVDVVRVRDDGDVPLLGEDETVECGDTLGIEVTLESIWLLR